MKRLALIVGIGLLFVFNAVAVLAAGFQATLSETQRGQTQSGPFYLLAGKYRMEVVQGGRQLIILVDRKIGKTRILVPSEGVFLEVANDDMQSLMNNPFEAHQHMIANYEARMEGTATVAGIVCDKQVIAIQDKDVMTAWIAKSYGFPIRMENQMNGSLVELKDVRDSSPKTTLFEVPAGLKLVKTMPIAPPEWAGQIAAAPIKTPPFKQTLREGQILRIKPKTGYHVRVSGRNAGSGKSAFTFVAFKDGRPLIKPSMGTYNISNDGGISATHRQQPGEADMFVVRASTGSVIIEAQFLEAPPKGVILKKYVLETNAGKALSLSHLKAARLIVKNTDKSGSKSSGNVQVYSTRVRDAGNGVTVYDNDQELINEPFVLNGGTSKTWYFDAGQKAGTINIDVNSGSVEIRTEQPEKAGEVPPSWAEAPAKAVTAPASSAPVAVKKAAAPAPQAASSVATSSGAARTVLVLDASGSMWGQIGGQAKIAIAKEVLTDLINDLPDDSHAGLVVYGHRSKGDCRDVEELVPLQPIDKKRLIAKIKAISPKGKTPITLSIRKTAEKLKNVEEESTIILVSDGKETCEGDPCALVKELKAAGIRFTMYVIGFDVSDEERTQLECIAQAGGGRYFTAKTAQEFRVAAKEAVKESRNFGYLKISALRNGKAVSARVDVFPQGEKKTVKSVRSVTEPSRPGSKLKPGVYDLTITDGEVRPPQKATLAAVTVTAGATTEKSVNFSGGGLSVAVLADGRKETAGLYVYRAGEKQPLVTGDTSSDNPKTFTLGPGAYDLRVLYKKVRPEMERRFSGIEVEAGQTIEKRVEFGEGKLSIEVLVNGKKGSAGYYIFDAGTTHRVTSSDTSSDNPKIVTLNPGMYDLQVVYRGSKPETERRFDGIEIKPGQTEERKAEFGEGRLSIEVLVNGKKGAAGYYVFDAGTTHRVTSSDTSSDNPRVVKLNPGKYDLKVVYRKAIPEKEIVLKNIEVVQAQTSERRVEYQEGVLNVNVTSGGQPTRGGLSFFRPGDARRIATGNAEKPIKMQPGQYEVAVKAYKLDGKPEKRFPFTIQIGQTTNLDVDF